MSLHADVVASLRSYNPPDPDQVRLREDYLAYVLEHDDATWRTCVPDHVTASALVVSPSGDRVLLALHRRAGQWFQTGGHLEAGDTTLAGAALREGAEESGLTDLVLLGDGPVRLDRHPAPCSTPGVRDHLDVQFVAVSRGVGEPVVSDESLDVRWFDAADPTVSADASVRSLVAAAAERVRAC